MQGSGGLLGKALVKEICSFVDKQNEELEAYRTITKRTHIAKENVIIGHCRACSFPIDFTNLSEDVVRCYLDGCMYVVECDRPMCSGEKQSCSYCGRSYCCKHEDVLYAVACCVAKVCASCHYVCCGCDELMCPIHIGGHTHK